MVRSFGVKEWEEGITQQQFDELLTDDAANRCQGRVKEGAHWSSPPDDRARRHQRTMG